MIKRVLQNRLGTFIPTSGEQNLDAVGAICGWLDHSSWGLPLTSFVDALPIVQINQKP